MKTTNHYSQVPQFERPMDTFPKPNTIPDGWDLSEMSFSNEPRSETRIEPTSFQETGNDQWDNNR